MRILLLLFICSYCAGQCPGGSGYTLCDAVAREWVIPYTDSQMVNALHGRDTVFVKEDFDLTLFDSIQVRACVFSDGHTLRSGYHFQESERQKQGFLMLMGRVEINGLVIAGDSKGWKFDNGWYESGIHCRADSCIIRNCTVRDFNYCGIWLYRSQGVLVDNVYMTGAKNSGYGYGAWVVSNGIQGYCTFRHCYFGDNREGIGSSGNNAWAAIDCLIPQDGSTLERHNSSSGGTYLGGLSGVIDNCHIYCDGMGYELPVPMPDSGNIYIRGNFFRSDSLGTGVRYSSVKPDFTPIMYGNIFSGPWIPQCNFTLTTLSDTGFVSASNPADSFEVNLGSHSEFFYSQDFSFNLEENSQIIRLRCWAGGIPSLYQDIKVSVGTSLYASYKITCDTDYYVAEVLVDNVVWAADTGDSGPGFRRFVLPSLTGAHTVCLRIRCIQTTTAPCYGWLDDFDCKGKISNSSFESGVSGWTITYGGAGTLSHDTHERASGQESFFIRWPSVNSPVVQAGWWCGVTKRVTF